MRKEQVENRETVNSYKIDRLNMGNNSYNMSCFKDSMLD